MTHIAEISQRFVVMRIYASCCENRTEYMLQPDILQLEEVILKNKNLRQHAT